MSLPKTYCRIAGCGRVHKGRGLCGMHYQRVLAHGITEPVPRQAKVARLCSIAECDRPLLARGYCGLHLQRVYTHGDPSISLLDRQHGPLCSVPGCARAFARNGLCRTHADRKEAHGSPVLADALAAAQGGRCAICGRLPHGRGIESRLHLDHDHRTGRRRGMLCGSCNRALGLLDENPAHFAAALAYLARHGLVEEVS